jgi:hypothetical protein
VRVALLSLALLWAMPPCGRALAQPTADTPSATANDDETWLARRLLSDVMRDSNLSDLACITRVILHDPDRKLVASEVKHPGVIDFVATRSAGQMRQDFAAIWEAARVEFAAKLTQFPAPQRKAMRSFFESPTGIKYIGYIYIRFPGAPASYDPGKGFEQCSPKSQDSELLDAVMTDDDARRIGQFPLQQETQLTPTFIVRLAGQFGVRTAQAFISDFDAKFGSLVRNARVEFETGGRPKGNQ